MALNPDWAQQSTRVLPFCLGWNFVRGSEVNSIFGLQNISEAVQGSLPSGYAQIPAEVGQYVLADGEWDSLYMFAAKSTQQLTNTDVFVGNVPIYKANAFIAASAYLSIANRPLYLHFHTGAYSTVGLPANTASYGPDPGTDVWLNYLPTVTPALPFSGYAYFFLRLPANNDGSAPSLDPVGVWRTTRCRIFDANGNVVGYGFTTNPTWQMIETLLRFQIKPQQPGLAGLTAAEQACFDWPVMVAHAQRNAKLLSNGAPQFAGNFAFASDTTLGAMMETQLRNCLSYMRVRGGKIQFVGEEDKTSVFTFSQHNMVPSSIKLGKKDLTNAPNIYVPQYRELGVPALVEVATAVTAAPSSAAGGGGFDEYYTTLFTTLDAQPFAPGDFFVYGGSADDADFLGTYGAYGSSITLNNVTYPVIYNVPTQVPANGGPQKAANTTGGYLGSQNSRFQAYAPEVCQHRSAQKLVAQVALGIAPTARQQRVFYDMGNNTFDQTNRVMQFLMGRDLGTDGVGWQAPFKGKIAGYLETIDANGNALLEVEAGDVITIDSTASPSFAGEYEVVDIATYAPSAQDGYEARRELTIQTYNPNAFTQVSSPPGDSFTTVPGNTLPMGDVMPSNTPFWLLQATPEASYDGSTGTIMIPDCTIMWMGQTSPTVYPSISMSGIPVGTTKPVTLYLVVTNQATTPTLLLDTTSPVPGYPVGTSPTGPPVPFPYGQILLFYGIFTDAQTFSEQTVAGNTATVNSAQAVPLRSGGSTGLVYTPAGGNLYPVQPYGTTSGGSS